MHGTASNEGDKHIVTFQIRKYKKVILGKFIASDMVRCIYLVSLNIIQYKFTQK